MNGNDNTSPRMIFKYFKTSILVWIMVTDALHMMYFTLMVYIQVLDQINKKIAMFRENYMILPRFLDEASLKIEALVKQSFIVSCAMQRMCLQFTYSPVCLFSYAIV